MRILLSGASGFIGAPLASHLVERGHVVVSLTRTLRNKADAGILWDPIQKTISHRQLEGFDAVIHLAAEPIVSGRWTSNQRKKILESRKEATEFLCRNLAELKSPPPLFLSASAVGYYGNRGEELLDEESSLGDNFLSHVCFEWEKASLPLQNRGARTVHLRFGAVLGRDGGILAKMIPFYRWGLGAKLGSGQQWMSWIALKDLLSIVDFALHKNLSGAVNVVSPYPVRQLLFSTLLAQCLHRPHFLSIPAPCLRLVLGAMADEVLLSSLRVLPRKLLEASFHFRYPKLEEALQNII